MRPTLVSLHQLRTEGMNWPFVNRATTSLAVGPTCAAAALRVALLAAGSSPARRSGGIAG